MTVATGRTSRLGPVALGLLACAALLCGCSSADDDLTEPVGDPPVGFAAETSDPSGQSAGVDLHITYGGVQPAARAVEVGGVVAELVEDGGRCTLVLSHPDHAAVRVEGEAVPDVRSTACALLSVPLEQLAPGTWTARLEYRSSTSSGSSDELSVEIP